MDNKKIKATDKNTDKNKSKKKNPYKKYQLIGAFGLATVVSGMGLFMTGIMESANPELFQETPQTITKGMITESSASKMLTGGGLFLAGTGLGIIAVTGSSVTATRRKPKPPTK